VKADQKANREVVDFIQTYLGDYDVYYFGISGSVFNNNVEIDRIQIKEKNLDWEQSFLDLHHIEVSRNVVKNPHLQQDFSASAEYLQFDPRLNHVLNNDDPVLYSRMTTPILGEFDYTQSYDRVKNEHTIEFNLEARPYRNFSGTVKTMGYEEAVKGALFSNNYAYNSIMYNFRILKPGECKISVENIQLKNEGIYPNSFTYLCQEEVK